MSANQKTTQMVVVPQPKISGAHGVEKVALFNEDGTPFGVAGDNSIIGDVVPRLDSVEQRLAALESKAK